MDFRQMLYFCTIVEQGQISKAAKKLNMSQPPLSLRLKELEDEIGTPLILRSGGRWEITKTGQLLYTKSRQILSHVNGLKEELRNVNDVLKGMVRIGICSHCISFFQKIVPIIAHEYPKITLRAIVEDSPTVEKMLREREIEIAVLRLQLSHNNCTTYNLPKQHFVAVFSNLLPAPEEKESIELEEVAQYPLLFSRRWANAEGFRPIVAAFQGKQLKPHIILDTQTPYLLFDLLYTTPAVALMPSTEIPQAHAHDFPVRRLSHYVVFQPVVAHLEDTYLRPETNAVLELLLRSNSSKEASSEAE